MGRFLVDYALQKNHEVTLFNRGKTNPALFNNIETIIGDRENDDDLEQLKNREWDVVIDTCGFTPQTVSKTLEILNNKVEQYIYISSASIYKNLISEDNIDENGEASTLTSEELERVTKGKSGRIEGGYYGALKYLSESVVSKGMENRWLIVRPGLIVGPHDPTDRFTYWPYRTSLGGHIIAPDIRSKKVQFIDVRDLAKWVIVMAEGNKTSVYNVNGPKNKITMEEFQVSARRLLTMIQNLFGYQRRLS
ncbi:NAD-dependent epimerase/dehydratase family protein [Halobacillus amylolyticus]|uniref:NAD-dependent epimerase/dehydratase family protein n=1 Tax=Halobacillus amylolyticus TaxID=2932259 RepID=A0ABY4HG85_9BACI|nr:NAD-dependent epimerase/dehydratase family protein [Halobacillus amylolyticus]UOR12885.1 NAD-dependent epimerase/dehydratase family protein [Halobacillus amylolyticus]